MVNLQPSDLQSKARDAVLKYPHRCPHPPAFSLRRYIGALNRSPVRPLHGRTLPFSGKNWAYSVEKVPAGCAGLRFRIEGE